MDKVTEENIVNQSFVHNKTKDSDSDNDELDHYSKTDKYQYKKNVHRTDLGTDFFLINEIIYFWLLLVFH